MNTNEPNGKLDIYALRLNRVLSRYPVSKSHWYAGIKAGRYPAPIKTYGNMSFWLSTDIDKLIEGLANQTGGK